LVVLKPLKGEPGTLAIVFVPLPDLRNEGSTGGELVEKPENVGPIHISFIDLQSFTINTGGIG
jgi:hypothetical protein